MTLKEFLTDIANAIRSGSVNSYETIPALDFPDVIRNELTENMSKGKEEGFEEGYKKGKNDGDEQSYNDFWDIYQEKGNRTQYCYAFGGKGWTDETFKPKYDIIAGNTTAVCLFAYSKISDLEGILNRQGIILDTSKATDVGSIFNSCSKLTNAPLVDASNANHCGSIFFNCTELESAKLKVKDDGSQSFSNTFKYCHKLCNFEITGGVIGENIDLRWSDLSKASVISVINALSDDSEGKTATFKSGWQYNADVKKAMSNKFNWTIKFI